MATDDSFLLFKVPDWDLGAPIAEQPAVKKKNNNNNKKKNKKNKEQKRHNERKQDTNMPHKASPSPPPSLPPQSTKNPKLNVSLPSKVEKAPHTALKAKLVGARFRYLNQKLYESTSRDAQKYFQQHPQDFNHYHEGFREQVKNWPTNPVDVFIKRLNDLVQKPSKPKKTKESHEPKRSLVLVDMGCGEAKIASTFSTTENIKVHSYDLMAINQYVTEASMTKVPLASSTADIVIFCLSLMNTDYEAALVEANRILRPDGRLWIAEVASRFDSQTGLEEFQKSLKRLGFKVEDVDKGNLVFVTIDATKCQTPDKRPQSALAAKPILKPCLYKKR